MHLLPHLLKMLNHLLRPRRRVLLWMHSARTLMILYALLTKMIKEDEAADSDDERSSQASVTKDPYYPYPQNYPYP